MHNLRIIAFTHQEFSLETIGLLHIEKGDMDTRLSPIFQELELEELMVISTCNRVEIAFVSADKSASQVFAAHFPNVDANMVDRASCYDGLMAVQHLLRLSSSLESMVVGEREILTQVRDAYNHCLQLGFTGDVLKLAVNKAIETAKQVYHETAIAHHPISVVNLAYKKLEQKNIPLDAKIAVVGAGTTNRALTSKMKKHGYSNFTVFNRTLENAEKLAVGLNGQARELATIHNVNHKFDLVAACTGATEPTVTSRIFNKIAHEHTAVVDLGLPADVEQEAASGLNGRYIHIERLKALADENKAKREAAISHCEAIIADRINEYKIQYRERQVAKAMRQVPQQVKELKQKAVNEVFRKEMETLTPEAQETLDKVLSYMEKKYIAGPMKTAREIMLKG